MGPSEISSEEVTGVQQAAVLFAAGHVEAAVAELRERIEEGERRASVMLLDLLRVMQRRGEFDEFFARVAARYGPDAHPGWDSPVAVGAPGAPALSATVVDLALTERVDLASAASLAAQARSWHVAGKRVVLANVSELQAALLEAFGVQRYAVLMRRQAAPVHAGLAA